MKFCLKCNLEYNDKYNFCKKCGNSLSVVKSKKQDKVKVCPKCKLQYERNYKFCKKCGTVLKVRTFSQQDLPKDGILVPSERTQLAMKHLFYLLIFVVFWGCATYFYISTFKYMLYNIGFNTLSDSEEFFEMGNTYSRSAASLSDIFFSKDYNKAFKFYQISADMGNRSAKYRLAQCYYFGRGVNKNKEEAQKWLISYFKDDKYELHERSLTQSEIDMVEKEFALWQDWHNKGWD